MKVELEIKTFGDYFRWQMQQRNVSTRDVANDLEMNPSTVWRIASGQKFDLKWLIRIAQWCNLTPVNLWDLLRGFDK